MLWLGNFAPMCLPKKKKIKYMYTQRHTNAHKLGAKPGKSQRVDEHRVGHLSMVY